MRLYHSRVNGYEPHRPLSHTDIATNAAQQRPRNRIPLHH